MHTPLCFTAKQTTTIANLLEKLMAMSFCLSKKVMLTIYKYKTRTPF